MLLYLDMLKKRVSKLRYGGEELCQFVWRQLQHDCITLWHSSLTTFNESIPNKFLLPNLSRKIKKDMKNFENLRALIWSGG
jgi:hypothetical protein